ncbi:ABC1 family protein, ubiquinone biosynthesis protein [Alcanivorax jadensis T9]|uniref:ABC1 family protein, ubiquinone biosynthesis protein n=3 Tax=Alcanivorax TaxID=59753 RepID=A0ABR4WGP5_9GAMM|nr:AarF/UbiB family protein [Alcanivorax jadensis]KGD62801.1 ABC1 family protein, ubiquinone biosynthesis protein [Alcanivorax jadensis T9]MDF1637158.1 AarF/UbiB family protein [Alcanivorax jadensis]
MSILHTGKDLLRMNELATILLKYGFADVIRRLGLSTPVEHAGKLVRSSMRPDMLRMGTAERLRHAMEEMGPTFVKLGQVLATRVDLFPLDWIAEFEKLQDQATAIPYEELVPHLEAALGKSLESAFARIDPKPIGVASIGQVHSGLTRRGQKVVLKIQKPGIRAKIESDLRLLDQLAKLAADNSVELRRYRPVELVREFKRSLTRELDFTIEARNADRIRKNLRSLKWLTVPRVYWELSSQTLQVQEHIQGIPARATDELDAEGLDRVLIARRGALAAWKMALEDGFFHADPHPGNFIIQSGNRIAMLDFGMVGKLSHSRREQILQITRSVVLREAEQCAAVLSNWSDGQPVRFDQLVSDVEDVISQYHGISLSQLDITALLTDITALVRNHNLVLPSDIALFIKAIITLEGFGRLLNPDFDLMTEAEPLLKRMIRTRYSPVRLAKSLSLRALDVVDKVYAPPHAGNLPSQQEGSIDPRHLERLVARLERGQYRQVQALLVSAGFIGGSLMLAGRVPPAPWEISLFGLIIFLGSAGWASWLMFVSRRFLREWE